MATPRRKTPLPSTAPISGQPGDDTPDIDRILNGNYGTDQTVVSQVKTRDVITNVRFRQEANEMADQVIGVEAMSAEEKIKVREKILQAKIEQLRQALPDDKRALGALTSTLNSSFQDLKEGFATVAQFTSEEQRVIDDAERAHATAAEALNEATQQREKANSKTTWFGIRERAVAGTQAALVAAQETEVATKTAIEVATATAQKMRDDRLQNADFEESFAFIEACVKQTKIAITERIKNLTDQSSEAEAKRTQSFERQQTAAKNMETSQTKVDELAARFQQESEARDQLPAGSSERVEADAKVAATQHEFEEARARHDQQLAIYQEMEKAIKALTIQETALRVGLHAHKVELARLTAGSDVWVVEARNRLAQIKSLASQQASQDLIEVNIAVRKDNVRSSAAFALASLRLVTEQAERHPHEMADMGVYDDSMHEGLQLYADRWKAVSDQVKAENGGASTPQGQ